MERVSPRSSEATAAGVGASFDVAVLRGALPFLPAAPAEAFAFPSFGGAVAAAPTGADMAALSKETPGFRSRCKSCSNVPEASPQFETSNRSLRVILQRIRFFGTTVKRVVTVLCLKNVRNRCFC